MEETTKKIKNENYITIQGWMVNELNLKGNELLIYAIIFGFSQTNGQVFNGSLQYLANWTNTTKQGVAKTLKLLVEKKYIIKNDKYINGVKFCEYYANDKVITKLEKRKESVNTQKVDGMQQSCIGMQQSCIGMQQSCINNIQDNIKENNKNNNILNSFNIHNEEDIRYSSNIHNELFLLKENIKEKQKENDILNVEFETLWSCYPNKQGKASALKSYIKARTKDKVDYDTIKAGLEKYLVYCQQNEDWYKPKNGSTWFNQQSWNDEYPLNTTTTKDIKKHKQSQGIVYEQLN